MSLPAIHPWLRIADTGGVIGNELHRWLQLIARTISSTYVADQAPQRNYVILTGQFGLHGKRLVLAGSERLTIEGTGRMVICG